MLTDSNAYSGFSTNDIDASRTFYRDALGLRVTEANGMLVLKLGTGANVLVYPKGSAHVPATYTVLNFPVENIEEAVDDLVGRGVEFEHYDVPDAEIDERGIMHGEGPLIAWFTDPGGNIFSVIEDKGPEDDAADDVEEDAEEDAES